MTNHYIDIKNADVILIMGSNAAEMHPISFKWVLRAKEERGAKIIHVDPRYTRTSALSDYYVGLRSGTDIAFLGGMIKYILDNKKYFEDYVRDYTNASFIINEKFSFNDGLFSGYDPATRKYDKSTWTIKLDANGIPEKDPTFQNPRCVLQMLKNHYDRYDLEKVSSITGTPVEDLKTVYELYASTGVKDRAGTELYALGWTQHTVGSQNIRTMAIIQLLLGNMGIAGGGINALRGEPNVQGSTDQAILSHILPGYLKAPVASLATLDEYLKKNTPKTREPQSANWYQNTPKYMVSLLKAWYGDKAVKENDFCYSYVPKLDDGQDATLLSMIDKMYEGKVKGFTCVGQDPAISLPNANKVREAFTKLDWMVHMNIFDNETASFWKGPGVNPKKVKTEVFLIPVAASMEKEGSMSNSGRMLQWKYVAEKPPGDALSTGDVLLRLMAKLKEMYKKEKGAFPDPILNLSWNYADAKGKYDPVAVAKAMNGYFLEDVTIGDKTFKKGQCVPGFGNLQADGKTSCGIWIHSGSFTVDGTNLIARRKKDDPTGLGLYPEWGWVWPMNRRIIYNRASVDKNGQPWDPSRPVIKWLDGKWVGDVPDGPWPPLNDKEKGKLPFIMKPDGVASLFGPGMVEGPFPEHYEPLEGPLPKNLMSSQMSNPTITIYSKECDKYAGCDPHYPFVCTTYSCTEHWCTGAETRWMSWLTEAQPQAYVEISKELAELRGIKNGAKVRVESMRGKVECVAMVTTRFRPFKVGDQIVHQLGMTFNYGWLFPKDCGDTANLLTPTVGDANTQTPEYKAFMVNVTKV
jgi:formate dehydrogenase major subunit